MVGAFPIHGWAHKARFDQGFLDFSQRPQTPVVGECLAKFGAVWESEVKKTGEGDGVFRRKTVGEACGGWIAYIVAEKPVSGKQKLTATSKSAAKRPTRRSAR